MNEEREEEYEAYLESDDWQSIRNNLIKERGLECERCHKECKKHELQVHHKHYDKELSYEDDDQLILLCLECHILMEQDLEFFGDENNGNDRSNNGRFNNRSEA